MPDGNRIPLQVIDLAIVLVWSRLFAAHLLVRHLCNYQLVPACSGMSMGETVSPWEMCTRGRTWTDSAARFVRIVRLEMQA